jgi:hypothetical protein
MADPLRTLPRSILAQAQVTTTELKDDAVTQAKIADDAVGADQLASDAVVTASITDGSVTPEKQGLLVWNATGGALAEDDLVYISGYNAANARPEVAKADADGSGTWAQYVVGAGGIANGAGGTVYREKLSVATLNTNAASAVGDPVYLHTTAGSWTLTGPANASAIQQVVGRVAVKSATAGQIYWNLESPVVPHKIGGIALLIDDSIGTANIAATAVGSTELAATTIQYAEVTLTAAEILDLADTPKTLVAAAAGKVHELVSIVLFLDHAGTGFAESADNLQVCYENDAGTKASEVIECTGFIDQTADTMTIGVAKTDVIGAKSTVENKALVLANINDDFTDAGTTTSVIRAKVAYRTHTTGW